MADFDDMTLPSGIAEAVFCSVFALGAGYGTASASWFLRKSSPAWRWSAFIALSGMLLACPFLVPRRYLIVRGFVSAAIVWWWMKSWGAFHLSMAATFSFPAYLAALLNFGNNVTRPAKSKRRMPPFAQRWCDAVCWGLVFSFALLLVFYLFTVDWSGRPFMAEHLAKVVSAMFGLALCGLNFHSALWRLGGVKALRSPMNALWAASPAEFWRRWNRPVQEWLFEYVFRPIADTGHTSAATVATFAASGILHEYIMAMASGRITGYPTAFFLVQSLGVLTTSRWEPRGWRRVLGVASTWAFNVVTSVLLFAALGAATTFYVNEVPRWARLR